MHIEVTREEAVQLISEPALKHLEETAPEGQGLTAKLMSGAQLLVGPINGKMHYYLRGAKHQVRETNEVKHIPSVTAALAELK